MEINARLYCVLLRLMTGVDCLSLPNVWARYNSTAYRTILDFLQWLHTRISRYYSCSLYCCEHSLHRAVLSVV